MMFSVLIYFLGFRRDIPGISFICLVTFQFSGNRTRTSSKLLRCFTNRYVRRSKQRYDCFLIYVKMAVVHGILLDKCLFCHSHFIIEPMNFFILIGCCTYYLRKKAIRFILLNSYRFAINDVKLYF